MTIGSLLKLGGQPGSSFPSPGSSHSPHFPHHPSSNVNVQTRGDLWHSESEGWKSGKGHDKGNSAALSALTLLAFLFFLHILQSCLEEMREPPPPPVMMMMPPDAGGGAREEIDLAQSDNLMPVHLAPVGRSRRSLVPVEDMNAVTGPGNTGEDFHAGVIFDTVHEDEEEIPIGQGVEYVACQNCQTSKAKNDRYRELSKEQTLRDVKKAVRNFFLVVDKIDAINNINPGKRHRKSVSGPAKPNMTGKIDTGQSRIGGWEMISPVRISETPDNEPHGISPDAENNMIKIALQLTYPNSTLNRRKINRLSANGTFTPISTESPTVKYGLISDIRHEMPSSTQNAPNAINEKDDFDLVYITPPPKGPLVANAETTRPSENHQEVTTAAPENVKNKQEEYDLKVVSTPPSALPAAGSNPGPRPAAVAAPLYPVRVGVFASPAPGAITYVSLGSTFRGVAWRAIRLMAAPIVRFLRPGLDRALCCDVVVCETNRVARMAGRVGEHLASAFSRVVSWACGVEHLESRDRDQDCRREIQQCELRAGRATAVTTIASMLEDYFNPLT